MVTDYMDVFSGRNWYPELLHVDKQDHADPGRSAKRERVR
jgi:hypothetical protein